MLKQDAKNEPKDGKGVPEQAQRLLEDLAKAKGKERNEVFWQFLAFVNSQSPHPAAYVASHYDKFKPYFEQAFKEDNEALYSVLLIAMRTGSKKALEHVSELLKKPMDKYKLEGVLNTLVEFLGTYQNESGNFLASNYSLLQPFLLANLKSEKDAGFLLLRLAATTDDEKICSDLRQHILPDQKIAAGYVHNMAVEARHASERVRRWLFHSMLELYANSKKYGLNDGEISTAQTGIETCLSLSPSLVATALESQSPDVVKFTMGFFVRRVNDRENYKDFWKNYGKIINLAIENALKGDAHYYEITEELFRSFIFPPEMAARREELLDTLFEKSASEKGWAFTIFILANMGMGTGYDYGHYKRVFEKVNNAYERGTEAEKTAAAKLVGVILQIGVPLPRPDELSMWDKAKMALYLLTSSGIVGRVFGSVDALIEAAKGNPPMGAILELIAEDGEARDFALRCASNSVKSAHEFWGDDKEKAVKLGMWADAAGEVALKKMTPEEIEWLQKVLKKALKNPQTEDGAKHLLHIIDFYQPK